MNLTPSERKIANTVKNDIMELIYKKAAANRDRHAEIVTHDGNMATASAAIVVANYLDELLKAIDAEIII